MNNYCSPVQVLLHCLPIYELDDNLISETVRLVVFMFNQFQRVTTGGLFIIHGLTAVGNRLIPHFGALKDFLIHACQLQGCDEMGVRFAIGLISDFSNMMHDQMSQYLEAIINPLLNVLSDNNLEP